MFASESFEHVLPRGFLTFNRARTTFRYVASSKTKQITSEKGGYNLVPVTICGTTAVVRVSVSTRVTENSKAEMS